MPIAREGLREIVIATIILGGTASLGIMYIWPVAVLPIAAWVWVIAFFRDPKRSRLFEPGELCAPADGTVTEITGLDYHDAIGGPATRIGLFLSLFNVHINRMPCAGRIRALDYRPGEFLDARHPESGKRNESNTVLIDPDAPLPGPVEVRQVAGLVARRIICHATVDQHFPIGARFGLIKFGSRTELVIPCTSKTEIMVSIGEKVSAGLTIMARQPIQPSANDDKVLAESVSVNPQV